MPNNYLRYSIISLLFLVPFVGLIVSNTLFFPFITGKNIAFRVLIELGFVLYAILALRQPEYRPKLTSIFLAFSAFIIVILAADTFGVYPFKSFWSNYERMEGFVTLIHLFAYFIMMSALFKGEKIWTRFFQTSLGVSVVMGLIAAGQVAKEGGRISAQLGNSTYLGIYMLFHIFIAGFLLVRVIERKGDAMTKWLVGLTYGSIILFDFYIFYNTGTRGALLGLAAGAFFTAITFAIWEKHRGLKILGISVLAIIVLAVGSLATFKESSFIKSHDLLARFSQLATFNKASLEQFTTTQGKGRFGIWGIAYEGFKERPVLGWGQDNFNYVFNKYYDPKIYDQEQWFDRAHNVFFDWLIAGGILGLLSYLALFVTAIIAIWRSRAHEKDLYFLFSDKVLLTALLIAYFIHNLFVFDSLTSYILFFGVLAFISIHDRKVFSFKWLERPITNETYILTGGTVAVIVGAVSLYYFSLAPYLSSSTLIKVLSYQSYAQKKGNEALWKKSIDSFDTSLSYSGTTGILEAREQLLQGTLGAVSSSNASNEVKGIYFNHAKQEFEKIFDNTPDDTRYHLIYGSFLTRIGQASSSTEMTSEGINHLLKAEEFSPRKQSVLLEIGAQYINMGQYKDAVVYFKKAFDLDTNYNDARFFYAIALIYAGDIKTSDEILKPLMATRYMGEVRLIRAYHDSKQLTRTSQAVLYKLNFAKSIAASGDKEMAIKEVQSAVSMVPSLKAEGDKVIAEIKAMK